MGRLVVSENISLDGVIQDPTGEQGLVPGGWFAAARIGDGDQGEWRKALLAEALATEALLLGRRTYEYFAARWPDRDGDYADRLNSMPKYVVSSTLAAPEWTNTTIVSGDVVDEVATLKDRLDGDLVVYASGRLVPTLLRHDLVDELRLVTFPLLIGAGERLFDDAGSTSLRLPDTHALGRGLALHTYLIAADD